MRLPLFPILLGSLALFVPVPAAADVATAPLLEIVEPVACGLAPADIGAITTFRWRAVPGTTNPAETRFIFLNTEDFGGDYFSTISYIRNEPDAPEWSEWETYFPPDLGASWTSPPLEYGSYVFAVQGRDAHGNVELYFQEPRNVRRCRFSQRESGPLITVTSPHHDPVVSHTLLSPAGQITLVADTPIVFCWTVDACVYGGTVAGYRYGWDITDPDDDSQWGMLFTPLESGCSPDMTMVPYGTHVFTVEAMDSRGYRSRASIEVTWRQGVNDPQPWSRRFGDGNVQHSKAVAVDDESNVVIGGEFSGTVAVGGGPWTGTSDAFVAKFNRFGTHLWSRVISGLGEQFIRGVAVDAAGSVYIAGYFYNSIVIGNETLTSVGNADVFLAMFDPHGTKMRAHRFGGEGEDRVFAIDVDDDSNILLTGDIVAGSASLGGVVLPAGMYVAKYDMWGQHLWSHSVGGQIGSTAFVGADDDGNVFLGGHFSGSADFGGGSLAAQSVDVFIAKLHADGSHAWSRHAGDAQDQYGAGVAIDPSGNIDLVGSFYGTIDVGNGPLVSNGGTDLLIAEFDDNGTALWSRRFGDGSAQVATGVAVGPAGNVVATGYYSGAIDFGGGPLSSAGLADFFVAKLDTDGDHIRSQHYGDAANQLAIEVDVDPSDDAIVFGEFHGSVDFGTGVLTSAGSQDIVIARLDSSIPVAVQPSLLALPRLTSYPNPFNPATTIAYEVPSAGDVTLAIYDVRGGLVRTLAHGTKSAGPHVARWDGRDSQGRSLASGVYFARLDLGNRTVTRKLTLLK